MADTDDDYEIGALLGAPVRAIQSAQIDAEREYVQFLLDYGMEESTRKVGTKTVPTMKLREFEFGMTRSIPDPTRPGEVVDREARIRAPLLSMIQLPAIGIEEATIDLTLDVQLDKTATQKAAGTPLAGAFVPGRAVAAPVLKGVVGGGSVTRNFRTHGKLTVSLKLRTTHDDDMHGRLARLIGEGLSASIEIPETK